MARLLDLKTSAGQALPAGLTMEFRMLFVELAKCKPDDAGADTMDPFDTIVENIRNGPPPTIS